MSRNIRRKNPPVSRASRRRDSDTTATSIDLSDDDGYSAVEDISDSEDDNEEDVNAAEESNIVTEDHPSASPRPHFQSIEQDEEDEDDCDEEEEQEEEEDDDEPADDNDEQTSWAGIVSEGEDHQISDFYQEASAFSSDAAGERHVRFDVPDSDSDSTETDDDHGDLFPDIFVSQTALDPAFRREIEDDPDDSSGSGSFWDYSAQYHQDNGDDDSDAEELIRRLSDDESSTPKASQSASLEAPTFDGVQELDGYESECKLMTRLHPN